MDLSNYIETIENYPEDGISFRDITPLMADGEAYRAAINQIVDYAEGKKVDVVCGPEARGFIVGCPVAYELGVGFVPARKKRIIRHFCAFYHEKLLTLRLIILLST